MNHTLKVFLACALGAFIGALVALQVNHNFWWLGLIAGFATGYVSYEFRKVTQAVPTAWGKATSWQPDREWWPAYLGMIASAFGYTVTMTIGAGTIIVTVAGFNLVKGLVVICFVSIVFGCMASLATATRTDYSLQEMKDWRKDPFANPLKFYVWTLSKWTVLAIGYTIYGIYWVIVHIPTGATYLLMTVVVFCKVGIELFRIVHSEIRLLCGVDAAIGAAVGYYFGSAIVGAIVGGLWGVLNFELISKRWLKLVPARK